jgi:hypothetical protein
MNSYYEMLTQKHSVIVAERYWEMEQYDFESCHYETWAEFETALLESPFCSLIFFKYDGNKDKMNECVTELWLKGQDVYNKDFSKIINIPRTKDLDTKFFTENIYCWEDWICEILRSQLRYEENDFAKKWREVKIKTKKAHLTALKAHPLYDLIVLKCLGKLKAMHYEINQYWLGY